eukprot:Ihof_evm2s96 gene=Ihof_evmTU2s96
MRKPMLYWLVVVCLFTAPSLAIQKCNTNTNDLVEASQNSTQNLDNGSIIDQWKPTSPVTQLGECPAFTQCIDDMCVHKSLLPFTWRDITMGIVGFFGCALSVVGGVGGGGLFVPVLMLLLNFEADVAVPISKSMILGSSVVSIFFVMRQRVNGRPAIDFGACAVLQPLCLAGTIVGVYLNVVLPSWAVVIVLTIVLGLTTYKTTLKAVKIFKDEQIALKIKAESLSDEESPMLDMMDQETDRDHEDLTLLDHTTHSSHTSDIMEDDDSLGQEESGYELDGSGIVLCKRPLSGELIVTDANGRPMMNTESDDYRNYRLLLEQEKKIRWKFVGILLVMWVILFTCSYGKRCCGCTPWFWVVSFAPIGFALIITMLVGKQLREEYNLKVRCSHPFRDSDFIFNLKNTVLFPMWALLAGVAAGMVGIGGGMVIGPLLLVMSKESDPAITSAISSFLVLFTSSATTAQFVLLNTLKIDYALYLASLCAVAGILGQLVLKPMIEWSGRKSFTLFALAIVIALSGILTVIQ